MPDPMYNSLPRSYIHLSNYNNGNHDDFELSDVSHDVQSDVEQLLSYQNIRTHIILDQSTLQKMAP
jgi:hypothetical protein